METRSRSSRDHKGRLYQFRCAWTPELKAAPELQAICVSLWLWTVVQQDLKPCTSVWLDLHTIAASSQMTMFCAASVRAGSLEACELESRLRAGEGYRD